MLVKERVKPQHAQRLSALIACYCQCKVTRKTFGFSLNLDQPLALALEHELARVVHNPNDRSGGNPSQRLTPMALEQGVERDLRVSKEPVKPFLIRVRFHLLRKTLARIYGHLHQNSHQAIVEPRVSKAHVRVLIQ